MTDYSHLIGKRVRIPARRVQDRIVGELLSWRLIDDNGCASAVIRRRSGATTFVGGSFKLELVR